MPYNFGIWAAPIGRTWNDDDEPGDEDAGDSRQIKWQQRITHSSEEDEEVEDERARVSLNSYWILLN